MTTDREAALYYLVWHQGMSIEAGNNFLNDAPDAIQGLAKAGRVGFLKSARALVRWIDAQYEDDLRFSA